jgi:hypothetical protein
MLFNGNNSNWYNWFNKNSKDSYKYSEKLAKLFSKGQSLADKINNLKEIKVEVTEKSLENNEKTFTLKVVGNLNLSNKGFIKEIAEQFASILDGYKEKKIAELSNELDSTIEEMKNVFPPEITLYGSSSSNLTIDATEKTPSPYEFVGDVPNPQNGTGCNGNIWVAQTVSNALNDDNKTGYIKTDLDIDKTNINWKVE